MEFNYFLYSSVTWDGIYQPWTQEIVTWTRETIFQNEAYAGDNTNQRETTLLISISITVRERLLCVTGHESMTPMEAPRFQRTQFYKMSSSGQNTLISNYKRWETVWLNNINPNIQLLNLPPSGMTEDLSESGRKQWFRREGAEGAEGEISKKQIFHFISSNWSN